MLYAAIRCDSSRNQQESRRWRLRRSLFARFSRSDYRRLLSDGPVASDHDVGRCQVQTRSLSRARPAAAPGFERTFGDHRGTRDS